MTSNAIASIGSKSRYPPGTQRLAAAEYNRIIRYVRAARGILTSAERGFLLECADRAKRRFERLRRQLAA
jgi:hypothetical protein